MHLISLFASSLSTEYIISFPFLSPVTSPSDFNFAPEREGLQTNVIIDGEIMEKDLKSVGMTKKELERQVREKGEKIEKIMLATVDEKKQLTIFTN